MNKKLILIFVLVCCSLQAFAFTSSGRNKLLGSQIKNALETYHYAKLSIDDTLSQKAFDQFLTKVDFGKQFLLQKDVKELSKFQFDMDDQMVSGDHKLLIKTMNILAERIKVIDQFKDQVFKEKFHFNKREKLELDPDKREFNETVKELKEYWRKTFKHATLVRYVELQEEQNNPTEDKKKDKKKKKEKKLTDAELLEKAREAIHKKYTKYFSRILGEDSEDHLEKFFNAISNVFDPHTNYLPPKKKEDFDIDISGSLEGIGAVLSEDGSYIKVVSIVPGGAAWRQKDLSVADHILMVAQGDKEPVSLVDMRVGDAVRYIRGKKGTEVRLTVKKADGTRKVIPIIRDIVQIAASYAKSSVIEHKKTKRKVGYIHVPKFYRDFDGNSRNCSDDVRNELLSFKKHNVDAVILDLRNNGGGALEDARKMTGLFIKKGPIVQIKNHRGVIEVLRDNDSNVVYDGPLIVMINRFSASASEIVAAALQDYGRAIIVGGKYSHGKGTVQAVLNLNQGPLLSMFGPVMGALKVTIQKFYRVTGPSTQYKGVTPDIIIPDPMGYIKNREQDLDYSLKWDKVPSQVFSPWSNSGVNKSLLQKNSNDRVSNHKGFTKIKESVAYLLKRREETNISISIKEFKKRNAESEKMSKKFKNEEVNKSMHISHFEESLQNMKEVKKEDKKKWDKDLAQRTKDWIEGLQKDTALEEAVYIIDDMIKMNKDSKVTMRK
ncbi:MAG: carboxy terminal-processing peptidase [Bdellovibrionales bacterium]|nr:carboxy terminal-processing peptidase [Bdellovibrionales bacterium]